MTLVYDGDGNRVSETIGGTTTKYLVDSLNPTKLPQVTDETVSGSVTLCVWFATDQRESACWQYVDAKLLRLRWARQCSVPREHVCLGY